MNRYFDIAVVGGGHAGIEAALVAANMGLRTALISLEANKIGLMSCNPAIGGLAKGQLVREIDALGGYMGKIIDRAGIHFKMLNMSKGPAVQSPRAQADRKMYASVAQDFIRQNTNITIIEDMATALSVDGETVDAVLLEKGGWLPVKAAVITAGTFLNGIIHVGTQHMAAGRAGELPARGITESLIELGFRSGRLKTGTPPRIDRRSIDYSKLEKQAADESPTPFSFSNEQIKQKQIDCYITYTNGKTHDILREGFSRSPMFTGRIKAIGPRYCPSIEDKIDRFADKLRHQIFLEPEGYINNEVYVNGFSTSLPGEIQERALRTVAGLEKAHILRLGYAVEYDFFPPDQLKASLETKMVSNLFFAGQINGTSGYEEAAAQGFMAGLNAALKLKGEKRPFILKRSEAYIGVLVDDLINKIHEEPYRMFTSRAEFRLILRQDNADLRLMAYGREFGLIDDKTWSRFNKRVADIEAIKEKELNKKVDPAIFNESFEGKSSPLAHAQTVKQLIKRPELKLADLLDLVSDEKYIESSVKEVEYEIKYSGYLDRQQALLDKFNKMESQKVPNDIDYYAITALSAEAREKLAAIRPANLGQTSRVTGVTPADISVLLIYIEKRNSSRSVSRETVDAR